MTHHLVSSYIDTVNYYLDNFLIFDKFNRKLWTSHVIINIGSKLFKKSSIIILNVVYHSGFTASKQLSIIKNLLKEEDNAFTKKLHL